MPVIASALSPNLSLKRIVRKPAVRSRGGIVVTQHRIASEVGARVLKEGGHAVDAAVAAAFAVGVVEPWMSGIGGVGAMQVLDAETGKITAFDFGARSPKRLKVEDFPLAGGKDEGNLFGWPAVKGNVNTPPGPKPLWRRPSLRDLGSPTRSSGGKPGRISSSRRLILPSKA
jgi:gamma-glutamyltranspeptidase/glutathione hydrolase